MSTFQTSLYSFIVCVCVFGGGGGGGGGGYSDWLGEEASGRLL